MKTSHQALEFYYWMFKWPAKEFPSICFSVPLDAQMCLIEISSQVRFLWISSHFSRDKILDFSLSPQFSFTFETFISFDLKYGSKCLQVLGMVFTESRGNPFSGWTTNKASRTQSPGLVHKCFTFNGFLLWWIIMLSAQPLFLCIYFYLCIWLCWVLLIAVACRIFSCGMWTHIVTFEIQLPDQGLNPGHLH